MSVPDLDELRDRLVGRELPVGHYRVAPQEAWLTADCLVSPPLPDGVLHPMFVFISSLVGVGYSIQDLFDLAEVTPEDGPLLGETDLLHDRPLRVGEELTVATTIVDLVRKQGRSGVFDLLTVEIVLTDADGDQAGRARNTYVYPRRS